MKEPRADDTNEPTNQRTNEPTNEPGRFIYYYIMIIDAKEKTKDARKGREE
jgi:hypothetical protein